MGSQWLWMEVVSGFHHLPCKKGHDLFRSWMEGENPQPRILYGTLDQTIGFFHHLLPVLGWSSKVADITFRSLISLVSNVHVSALNRFRKLCHFCLVVLRKKAVMFPRCFHISSSAFGFVKFLAQNSSQKSTFKIKLADSKKTELNALQGCPLGAIIIHIISYRYCHELTMRTKICVFEWIMVYWGLDHKHKLHKTRSFLDTISDAQKSYIFQKE